ncbi:MAG: CehA/McbA family metallohydrolase [Clostridiales bacterium]|nr:CehA/McbA family metallohydrolase [Clostridiales bacterium]
MEKKVVISFNISKEQHRQYFKVPFDVPKDVEALEIAYSYSGDQADSIPSEKKNVIDLALLDQNGNDVGASGSSVRQITLSESYSSPGYKKLPITEGKWHILCGVYMIKDQSLTVTYTITFKFKKYRYLKGDTHLHSIYSDGVKTMQELGVMARKQGLDFMIMTDHNSAIHNEHLPDIPHLNIIPGVELTHYYGHVNLWGKKLPYKGSFAVNSFDDFKSLIEEARQSGAIVSLNHPYCSLCPWRWDLDFYRDAIEVWNGPMRLDNMKTIEWWRSELLSGKKTTIIGGSDYHFTFFKIFNFFARPTTRVYAKANTKEDILDAIKKGRCVITDSAKSSMIYLSSGHNVVGDTVKLTENTKAHVKVDKLKKGHTLIVNNQHGQVFKYKAKKTAPFEKEFDITEKGFIQAEIWRKPNLASRLAEFGVRYVTKQKGLFKKIPKLIFAITNPIYFE